LAVPKKKKSQSKTKMRRAQYKITLPNLTPCPNCGELKMPHRVCPACGYYNGRQVVSVEEAK